MSPTREEVIWGLRANADRCRDTAHSYQADRLPDTAKVFEEQADIYATAASLLSSDAERLEAMRERCAEVADGCAEKCSDPTARLMGFAIAVVIRALPIDPDKGGERV